MRQHLSLLCKYWHGRVSIGMTSKSPRFVSWESRIFWLAPGSRRDVRTVSKLTIRSSPKWSLFVEKNRERFLLILSLLGLRTGPDSSLSAAFAPSHLPRASNESWISTLNHQGIQNEQKLSHSSAELVRTPPLALWVGTLPPCLPFLYLCPTPWPSQTSLS